MCPVVVIRSARSWHVPHVLAVKQCKAEENHFDVLGIGKRVLTCHLTAENERELKFIWSGNTWAFRDAMDERGIKGRLVSCGVCVPFGWVLSCACMLSR